MSKKCELCGKGQASGNAVSHSNRHTRRKWNVNIQTLNVEIDGTPRKIKACTRCIRTLSKTEKAV